MLFNYLLVIFSIHNLLAKLPEEIDYETYLQRYQQVESLRLVAVDDLDDQKQHIVKLNIQIEKNQENQIKTEREISATDKLIKQLQQQISFQESELQEARKGEQLEARKLQNLETQKSKIIQEIRHIEQSIAPVQNQIDQLDRSKKSKEQDIESKSREISVNRDQLTSLEQQISRLQTLISNIKKQIADLQVENVNLTRMITKLKDENEVAKSELSKAQDELQKLIPIIKNLEARIQRIQLHIDRLISQNNPQMDRKIAELKSELAILKREQEGLFETQEKLNLAIKRMDQKIRNIQSQQVDINKRLSEIEIEKKQKEEMVEREQLDLSRKQAQERSLVAKIKTQEQVLGELKLQYQNLQFQIANLERSIQLQNTQLREKINQKDHLQRQLNQTQQFLVNIRKNIQSINSKILEINNQQSKAKNYLTSQDQRLLQLRAENREQLNQLQLMISEKNKMELRLAQLTEKAQQAFQDYQIRQDLFNYYQKLAIELGESQTNSADQLGAKAGAKLAKDSSQKIGLDFGLEMGKFQSELVGMLRGEILGYQTGYPIGFNDPAVISKAEEEGTADGELAAVNFAQNTLRPRFFEEFLSELITAGTEENHYEQLKLAVQHNKRQQMISISELIDNQLNLKREEIMLSLQLSTSLDSRIKSNIDIIGIMNQRMRSSSSAIDTFRVPKPIPYQSVDCTKVYKQLKIFKEACEQSYRELFYSRFSSASKNSYQKDYSNLFWPIYRHKSKQIIDENYSKELKKSEKIAYDEAIIQGRRDIHEQTYEQFYQHSYEEHIDGQTEQARDQAQADVKDWLNSSPLLTIRKVEIDKINLKGGDKAQLLIHIENIGENSSNGSNAIQIENYRNMIFQDTRVQIPAIQGRSNLILKIPFQVQMSARSADEIVVKLIGELPGDKYQAIRIEKHEVQKSLGKNTLYNLNIEHKDTVRSRFLIWRKNQKVTLDISPKFENLDESYELELIGLGEWADNIQIKIPKQSTRALSKGEQERLIFKYKVDRRARKNDIELAVLIRYLGEIIGCEVIKVSVK